MVGLGPLPRDGVSRPKSGDSSALVAFDVPKEHARIKREYAFLDEYYLRELARVQRADEAAKPLVQRDFESLFKEHLDEDQASQNKVGELDRSCSTRKEIICDFTNSCV